MSEQQHAYDWFRILADLLRSGKPHRAVARETEIPVSTLRGWWLGNSEPLHENGERLIEYWCSVTGNGRDSAPRRRRYSRSS